MSHLPDDINSHPDSAVHEALWDVVNGMGRLNELGYRVSTQDGLYFTNGEEDLELYHDHDYGWYYEVEEA